MWPLNFLNSQPLVCNSTHLLSPNSEEISSSFFLTLFWSLHSSRVSMLKLPADSSCLSPPTWCHPTDGQKAQIFYIVFKSSTHLHLCSHLYIFTTKQNSLNYELHFLTSLLLDSLWSDFTPTCHWNCSYYSQHLVIRYDEHFPVFILLNFWSIWLHCPPLFFNHASVLDSVYWNKNVKHGSSEFLFYLEIY